MSAAHFKTGLTGRDGRTSFERPCLLPSRSILFNDPLLPHPVISSSNLSSSTRGRGARWTPAGGEEGGGDEATNRNYPSLNMRFTESTTIQIRRRMAGRISVIPCTWFERIRRRIEREYFPQIGTIIPCLLPVCPSVAFVTESIAEHEEDFQICLSLNERFIPRGVDGGGSDGAGRGNVRGWESLVPPTHLEKTRVIFRAHGRSVSREERIGDARKSLPTCILISSLVRIRGRSFLSSETGLITGLGQ